MRAICNFLPLMNALFSLSKAKSMYMQDRLTRSGNGATSGKMKKGAILLLPLMGLGLSGCVQVTAPDKPIVINLNIAIRSEVLVKLDQASKKVIEENPGIF